LAFKDRFPVRDHPRPQTKGCSLRDRQVFSNAVATLGTINQQRVCTRKTTRTSFAHTMETPDRHYRAHHSYSQASCLGSVRRVIRCLYSVFPGAGCAKGAASPPARNEFLHQPPRTTMACSVAHPPWSLVVLHGGGGHDPPQGRTDFRHTPTPPAPIS
ncbi:unnamed protein product, partial [Ectocarpus sp. 4 AP-2014]